MPAGKLGDEVAIGLLAGPEEFERLGAARRDGHMAGLWRQFEEHAGQEKDLLGSMYPVGDLALAAAVTRRSDLARKAIEFALEMARRPHWIQPEAGCIGLHGMHIALELCLAIDWLWPMLGPDQREALLGAVIAKGIENLNPTPPGVRDENDGAGQLLIARRMDRHDPCCLHPLPAQVNNWDFLFAATLYLAAALADRAWLAPDPAWPELGWGRYYDVGYTLDPERIARWKQIAVERVTTGIAAQLGDDGDYAESPSYVIMGTRGMMMTLTALERVDGTDLWPEALGKLPRWLRNQYVADIGFGVANYNDSLLHHAKKAGSVLPYLAARSGDPESRDFALEAFGAGTEPPDAVTVLGLQPTGPTAPMTLPLAALYRHTGQVIWRTAQDRTGVFFSIRSGAHGGAHQHNDRNSIFLSAYGEHMIVDTGDGRYADPPSDPRFDQTHAHNCVLVDGRGQIGSNAAPVAGRILEHHHQDDLSTALADASACYQGLAACRRRVVFVRPDLFVVSDRVEGRCASLTWLLQGYNPDAKAAWTCADRHAVLARPLARLHVVFLEPVIHLRVGTGTCDGRQRDMLRLEADVPGQVVTAVLVPVRPDEPEPNWACRDDGALTLYVRDRTHVIAAEDETIMVNGQAFSR